MAGVFGLIGRQSPCPYLALPIFFTNNNNTVLHKLLQHHVSHVTCFISPLLRYQCYITHIMLLVLCYSCYVTHVTLSCYVIMLRYSCYITSVTLLLLHNKCYFIFVISLMLRYSCYVTHVTLSVSYVEHHSCYVIKMRQFSLLTACPGQIIAA